MLWNFERGMDYLSSGSNNRKTAAASYLTENNMKSTHENRLRQIISKLLFYLAVAFVFTGISCGISPSKAATVSPFTVTGLRVEYSEIPLGVDVESPRFSWQMTTPVGKRDYAQTAYQIIVKDPKGTVVWDTGKVASDVSLGIQYAGSPLQATTRYNWTVTVWEQRGDTVSGASWFETGLMNHDPGLSAWDGATWIGGGNEDLVFYSHYLSIFNLKYTQAIEQGSNKASFILGANDIRLMDKNKNIYQVESGKNGSYVKLELDISAVDGTEAGRAKLNVYRVGYTDRDSAKEPFQRFDVLTSVINNDNKYREHNFEVNGNFGNISIAIDGNRSFMVVSENSQQGDRGSRSPGGFGPGMFLAPQMFSQADKNGDQKLTKVEFTALADAWFDKLDSNKTGKLSQEQFIEKLNDVLPPSEGFRPPGGPRFGPARFVGPGLFTVADADKNGSLIRAELKSTFEKWYGQWDSDKSGALTEEKLRDGLNAVLPQPEFGGPGGGRRRRGGGGASVNINPMGSGGNFITFGMICDMGFSVDAGQKASFSNIVVYNNRAPNNTLFSEDLTKPVYDGIYADFAKTVNSGLTVSNGKYVLDGDGNGAFVVANPSRNSTPMLRTEFKTDDKKITVARLYVTARGIYEIYLNGKRVGDDNYNPGLTQYNLTHMYQTYDVTDMVNNGENAIGAMLGEGWWSGLLSFGSIWNHFGDRQSLLAKLVITYQDGSRDVVTTNDKDWKYYNNGPILYSSLDLGEVYDATKEAAIEGWSTAAYDDSAWKKAVKVPLEGTSYLQGSSSAMPRATGIPELAGMDFGQRGGRGVESFGYDKMSLIGQIGNNAGLFKTLTAQSVKEVREGVYVYNMGQNFVGVPRITIANGKTRNTIVLRVAEMLYPDLPAYGNNVGMIMRENYRAALSQNIYTMKDGYQVFQPRFTSHGYQYIEITGLDKPLPLEAVQGVAISSVRKLTADYKTSNEKVNRLWLNLVWSNVDNFLTIPTDCPQRNERMGWGGDISVFSRTATYVSNAGQFLRRHMIAMRNMQGANGRFTDIAPVGGGFGGVLWGSAGITVPWEAYQQYNDVGLLKEHYNAMAAYVDYLATTINQETGLSSDGQLGDWLGPQNNTLGSAFLVAAYHVYDLRIVAKTAEILGKDADAEKYRKMYNERKEFFNSRFVNENNQTLRLGGGGRGGFGGRGGGGDGSPQVADTQTSYAVGLALAVFSDDKIPSMAEKLAETVRRENVDDEGVTRPSYSLMTGFIGTAWISKALSDRGYSDLAYRLLQNNKYPSWLYAVDQGATTIWERLNGYTVENGFGGNNSMNSFNHYSFGAVGQWMMAYSLGIQRDEPGFNRFILQPEPDPTGEMTWAQGYYDSMYGRINSAWKVNDGVLTYAATVPANTNATLYIPAASASAVTEGGKPAAEAEGVSFVKYEAGKAIYKLKSGSYEFVSKL